MGENGGGIIIIYITFMRELYRDHALCHLSCIVIQ